MVNKIKLFVPLLIVSTGACGFFVTSCAKAKIYDINTILFDTDLDINAGDVPAIGTIYDYLYNANKYLIGKNGLTVDDLGFTEPDEHGCTIYAKDDSEFFGTVDVTYNTIDPIVWVEWDSVSSVPVQTNLLRRNEAEVRIGTYGAFTCHWYSFTYYDDDGTAYATRSNVNPSDEYEYKNFHSDQIDTKTDLWDFQQHRIWHEWYGGGSNTVHFDIVKTEDNSTIVSNFTLIFNYYFL